MYLDSKFDSIKWSISWFYLKSFIYWWIYRRFQVKIYFLRLIFRWMICWILKIIKIFLMRFFLFIEDNYTLAGIGFGRIRVWMILEDFILFIDDDFIVLLQKMLTTCVYLRIWLLQNSIDETIQILHSV